jgi:RHS repeat-associated protein
MYLALVAKGSGIRCLDEAWHAAWVGGDRGRSWRLVSVSDGTTLGYDGNGNVLTRTVGGAEWRYVYDPENRLVEAWRGAERVASFRYDPEGNRVVREVGGVRTVVVDDGYEVRGGGVRKVYRLSGETVAVREGSTVDAAVGDHLGSVTVLAQGGSVAGATRYLPYGAIRWESGLWSTDRRFTGQRWEASLGLYDYKARFYDPILGRFLQPDPIVPEPGNPQALNRYAYVYNNPLRYTDPSGHCPWCVVIAKTLLQTAVDVGIDYLIARATGTEFHLVPSLAVNAAVNVTTLGVGSTVAKLRHLGKLALLARHADEATEAAQALTQAARHADEAAEALRAAERLSQAGISLERFRSIGRESIPHILEAFGDAIRPMGDIPEAFRGRRITTLGRTWDIEAAKELGGFRVLDDPNWTIERNFEWLKEAIENGDVFCLASPVTEANLWNPKRGDVTVYLRELDMILQAGYRRIGDYLIPPQ